MSSLLLFLLVPFPSTSVECTTCWHHLFLKSCLNSNCGFSLIVPLKDGLLAFSMWSAQFCLALFLFSVMTVKVWIFQLSHCSVFEFFESIRLHFQRWRHLRRLERVFLLLQCLWNDGRLQRRIFNGVGKLYVSLQLYCWAILWGYLWRHISYHGNARGPQKRPLNFSFCKLSEKLIRWPIIFISLLKSSLNSLTFQAVWKKFI